MITPLRKRTLDGALYTRSAGVETLLKELDQLPRDKLVARCQIAGRNEPGYVPSECLMYLVRSTRQDNFPDPERVMAEFARVVAPGGFAALSRWESFSRNRINGIFYDVIAKLGVSAPSLPQGPPVDRFSNAQTFAEFVQATKFTDVHVASVASTYRLSNVDQLWELAMGSFARASSLILAQDQDIQRAIGTAVGEAARQYTQADGPHIPIAFLVVSGKRSFDP